MRLLSFLIFYKTKEISKIQIREMFKQIILIIKLRIKTNNNLICRIIKYNKIRINNNLISKIIKYNRIQISNNLISRIIKYNRIIFKIWKISPLTLTKIIISLEIITLFSKISQALTTKEDSMKSELYVPKWLMRELKQESFKNLWLRISKQLKGMVSFSRLNYKINQ